MGNSNTTKQAANYQPSLAAFIAVASLIVTTPAFADTLTLGEMMCSVSRNMAPFEKLFVGVAYIMGAIMIGIGVTQLGYFTDSINASRQYGISRPKGYLIGGSGLLALPAFIRLLVNSLFNFSSSSDAGGGLSACIPYAAFGGTAGNVGLDGLMLNLIMNIKSPMIFMLSVISILIGTFLVINGLVTASKYGQDPRTYSIPKILSNLVVGAVLYTVGMSLNEIIATVFGSSTIAGPGTVTSAIAFNFGADTQPFQTAVYAALTFFQLIGMIAFIRGWLILKKVGEGAGNERITLAAGLTHIFGGVLAVNIYRFLEAMDATFGTGFFS
ncbi:hypothetical protein [Hyphomicrobium sp.]|jgi:hypothetical protein|uniref:hypothetical protein n=1 Tax=Hyphomicrobium sp. TaxID=82 RepID=UPI003567C6B2